MLPIGVTNFLQPKAKTKDGNDYNKSNIAKTAGISLGVAKTSYNLIKNGISTLEIPDAALGEFLKKVIQSLKNVDMKKESPKIDEFVVKHGKKVVKAAVILALAWRLLLGWAVGGITDSIIGKVRKRKADSAKKETEQAPQTQPSAEKVKPTAAPAKSTVVTK